MRLLERLVFLLLLFTFPIQLGRHFWPDFAFIQGIRIDYLSPTFYLSDLLFIVLLVISFNHFKKKIWKVFSVPWTLVLLFAIAIGAFYSKAPMESVYGAIKLFEFILIAIYTAHFVKRENYCFFLFPFILGSLVETIIILFQFISQKSLGGIFYFLGERTFDLSTPGIALFRLGDSLILRPYGTFPHPNVLAFYLFCSFVLLLFTQDFRTTLQKNLKTAILVVIGVGIGLTFSRVIIMLTAASVFLHFRNSKKALLICLVSFCAFFFLLVGRFENEFMRDVKLRFDLLSIAWNIFMTSPIFGVGMNNFYYHEISYQKSITPVLLQPVHNIYLLWANYVGIIGSFSAAYFIYRTIIRTKSMLIAFLIFSFLLIGLFDHYILTLQQGQMLLAFVIGIAYSELNQSIKV